jgi:hypothetical protein
MRDNGVPAARQLKILIRGLILLAALVINIYAQQLREGSVE